jgi:PAS domain S-box-containing protein
MFRFLSLKTFTLLVLSLVVTGTVWAQWATPTIDGFIANGEYGPNNQLNNAGNTGQTWYMTWDASNLYVGVVNANIFEGLVLYVADANNNISGNTTGFNYEKANFSSLPFRATFVTYVKNGYREYRNSNGVGRWGNSTANYGRYADNGNNQNTREVAIPWTAINASGIPSQFVFFGYLVSSGGYIYAQAPTDNNITGFVGLNATATQYFAVVNTGNGTSTPPFSKEQVALAYYQTTWFRGLCVLAFFTLLLTGYQMRVHQLQEQEKKFRDAVETMPALAFVADPKGKHTFMNRGWLEYTGLSPEEAPESGWEKTIHPDDLNRHTERWRASDTTGQPLDYEARLRRGSDGVYRWFLVRAVPVRDKHGKIVKWCGAATDIEEREKLRQLEADLAHINRVSTLGEMAASLAHEIKQPIAAALTSANSCIKWLAHEPPNLDRARAAAARMDEYGNRAAEIIDRIRSFYKKSPPQRELVDVNGIVHEILALLRAEAIRYPIAMRAELTTALPQIMADRVQLQQVFMNLVLNAIEAMKDSGGELTVKSELGNDGRVLISVSDTGVGLPAGKVDEIFSAFFTTKAQGSGMGLAISRSIVESHGGRLWATANNGRGATFHVTLPIAAELVRVSDTAG